MTAAAASGAAQGAGGSAAVEAGDRMSARRSSRLEREERTLAVMVGMYCRDHHQAGAGRAAPARNDAATDDDVRLPRRRRRVPIVRLCPDCDGLLVYAGRRLAATPPPSRPA